MNSRFGHYHSKIAINHLYNETKIDKSKKIQFYNYEIQ
jgi:hypothetical protein